MLIARVMTALVAGLVQDGQLELAPGATQEAVVAELLGALGGQAAFAQLGPFVSGVLLRSELVDELYVDDRELIERLNELGL